MILVDEYGATERASRHKHRPAPPGPFEALLPGPPRPPPFVSDLLATYFQDYVKPLCAPLVPRPPRRTRTSRQSARRVHRWVHRPPASPGPLKAAYASLFLFLCFLLLLPPCADSLSRIRGQENVTRAVTSSSTVSPSAACGQVFSAALSPAPSSSSAQCLVLSRDMAHEVCSAPVRMRKQRMRALRLRFCHRYLLYHVIGPQCHLEGSEAQCRQCLADVSELDGRAREMYRQFEKILRVVEDCAGNFSTHWSCDDCKGAYRAWLCSTLVPYHERGQVISPCSHFCETVENRCPYFVPHTDSQYAGEPSFLCRDVSIRFKLGHTEVVPPEPSDSCYGPCHMLKKAPSRKNVNNYTMSSSDSDNELCYLKGRTSQSETSTAMPQVTSQSMTSQLDASRLPTSRSSSSSSSLRTPSLVLAQVLFWSIKTLTLHRDIGLT